MKKTTKVCIGVLVTGIAYYIWLKAGGRAIPCMFRKITGWKCPGCGITTMLWNLLEFDFLNAYRANPFLFVTGPFLLAEILYLVILSYKERGIPKWNEWILGIYTCALIIFGILRNINA